MTGYRVIVRFSLNNDSGSKIRNYIQGWIGKDLPNAAATGTWESPAIPLTVAAMHVAKLLEILSDPINAVGNADPKIELDHIWIYIDRQP